MGSPYRVCDATFRGEWIPDLPPSDWQNIKAVSPDKNHTALVRWNAAGNVPGFHVIRIDVNKRRCHKTRRIMGLCKKIYWKNGGFSWEIDRLDA